jgi:hypothetical protein
MAFGPISQPIPPPSVSPMVMAAQRRWTALRPLGQQGQIVPLQGISRLQMLQCTGCLRFSANEKINHHKIVLASPCRRISSTSEICAMIASGAPPLRQMLRICNSKGGMRRRLRTDA